MGGESARIKYKRYKTDPLLDHKDFVFLNHRDKPIWTREVWVSDDDKNVTKVWQKERKIGLWGYIVTAPSFQFIEYNLWLNRYSVYNLKNWMTAGLVHFGDDWYVHDGFSNTSTYNYYTNDFLTYVKNKTPFSGIFSNASNRSIYYENGDYIYRNSSKTNTHEVFFTRYNKETKEIDEVSVTTNSATSLIQDGNFCSAPVDVYSLIKRETIQVIDKDPITGKEEKWSYDVVSMEIYYPDGRSFTQPIASTGKNQRMAAWSILNTYKYKDTNYFIVYLCAPVLDPETKYNEYPRDICMFALRNNSLEAVHAYEVFKDNTSPATIGAVTISNASILTPSDSFNSVLIKLSTGTCMSFKQVTYYDPEVEHDVTKIYINDVKASDHIIRYKEAGSGKIHETTINDLFFNKNYITRARYLENGIPKYDHPFTIVTEKNPDDGIYYYYLVIFESPEGLEGDAPLWDLDGIFPAIPLNLNDTDNRYYSYEYRDYIIERDLEDTNG